MNKANLCLVNTLLFILILFVVVVIYHVRVVEDMKEEQKDLILDIDDLILKLVEMEKIIDMSEDATLILKERLSEEKKG